MNKLPPQLKLKISLHNASSCPKNKLPALVTMKRWVSATVVAACHATHARRSVTIKETLAQLVGTQEVALRMVKRAESAALNHQYRHKDTPTNVLSFPLLTPPYPATLPLLQHPRLLTQQLGDLVICVPIVQEEAAAQHKTFFAHLAHLIVHGTLHLLGYTHDKAPDAAIMETQEVAILKQLRYPDPYV